MRKRTSTFAAVVFSLTTLVSGAALADTGAEAEALYQQGMKLLEEKKVEAACVALEKSEKLDARGGTLLSVAYCHEQQGKHALAYAEYDESLRRLRLGGGRQDREKFAFERMQAVKDKVVFVGLELGAAVNAPGIEAVIIPGKTGDPERKLILGAERQKQLAFDPDGGTYRVEVRAPARKPFITQVQVAGKTAAPASITVTELASDSAAVAYEADGSGQRMTGLIVGGAGIAFAAVGGVFGVLALKCAEEVRKNTGCDRDEAKVVDANIANIGIGLGAVGIVVGSYLFFTAPKGRGEPRTVGLRPMLGPTNAGFSLDGRF